MSTIKGQLAGVCVLPAQAPARVYCAPGGSSGPNRARIDVTKGDPLLPDVEERALLERLARTQAALERERAQAPSLCDELLALPPEQQAERAGADPLFHTWGVCEALLARSVGVERSDPEECARLASLTLTVAGRLDGDLHATPVVQDLEARAWACIGGSRLRAGDLAGAEAALRESAGRLAHGTGDLLVEARLLEFEAFVRRSQGRSREAAALFRQAESRYREINEAELAARARVERERSLAG